MGAADFRIIERGASAREAFVRAQEQARHERGHGGYSGTIAEKPGYVLTTNETLSLGAAQLLASRLIENNDKWGDAGAIPVAPEAAVERRTVQVSVTLTDEQAVDHLWDTSLADLVKPLLTLHPGERIARVEQVEKAPSTSFKTEIAATDGEMVTTYHVVDRHRQVVRGVDGCLTLASARRALSAWLKRERPGAYPSANEQYEIIGLVTRQDGSGLVRGVRRITRRVLKLRVTLDRVAPGARPDRWLFFGYASS
jgi:hypothetical protein